MGAYIHRVPILVGYFYSRYIKRSKRDKCTALAAFYTTGMTVALMGFALDPLDCLLQCYESINTAGK